MKARFATIFLGIVLVFLVSFPSYGDVREVLVFRDVEIPWTLRNGEVIIEKGNYDVCLSKHGIELYCLKIRQNGKIICLIKDPKKIEYEHQDNSYELMRDPNVPNQPTLRLKRNPALNTVYFVVETGNSDGCRFKKMRFQLESQET